MPRPPAFASKGFSLLELLIVIVIVLGVYFLGFSGLEKRESAPERLTALNLKSAIMNTFSQGEGSFMCTHKCRKCFFRKSPADAWSPYEHGVELEGTETYTVDATDSLLPMEYGRYDDNTICLQLHFYKNGSSTQTILKNENGVYFLPAYFGKPQKVDTLDQAQELWLRDSKLISGSGDFY